ncbi:MAG TPA: PH domain-containing protein [Marmoricola sp.]
MTELDRDTAWRHLDPRMLLVHPVNELVRFLPLVIGVIVLGSGDTGAPWEYVGVVVPIAIGIGRFLSTRFRISTAQIELRRGLLNRSVLTAPLDRVRTVELTASPIHRLLGLAKVEIGTGSGSRTGDSRLVLDSLAAAEARRLRTDLLHRAEPTATAAPEAPEAPEETLIVAFDPAWARYAPLTTSGFVIVLAALGAAGQVSGNVVERLVQSSAVDDQVGALPLVLAVPAAVVAFVVVVSALAIGGYLLANWGFTLSRDGSGRAFHVRRGLLTTRETSLDVDRLRGLESHEPLGLRLGGGGRLSAVVTGLSRRSAESTTLLPAAPRALVLSVGEHVLGEAGPLSARLVLHGPAARRRRFVRALAGTGLAPVVLGLLALLADWPVWAAVIGLLAPAGGLLLAADRYAGLGHALTDRHLVVRAGSFAGRRDVLQRAGIIGWNIRQSWFQRRAGLVTLTATTAAGKQAYSAVDVPEQVAVALADAAVPDLVGQFLRSSS